MIGKRPVRIFGWMVLALLTVRGVIMVIDPVWWLDLISDQRNPTMAMINSATFQGVNEIIIGCFVMLSLTTNWNMMSALWCVSLLTAGHLAVDISHHVADHSSRDVTSWVYIQNHLIHPMVILYAVLFTLSMVAREDRYLNSEFTY